MLPTRYTQASCFKCHQNTSDLAGAEKINFKGKVIFNGKMDGQMRKPSDNSKLKKLLPNYEFITIEDGIDETRCIGTFSIDALEIAISLAL